MPDRDGARIDARALLSRQERLEIQGRPVLLSHSFAFAVCRSVCAQRFAPPRTTKNNCFRHLRAACLVACGQLAGWCAARPFALPRSRLSASRPVLSACSAICPPLLARSMMLPYLLSILPFSSNSGFSLLFFRLRRACRWLWFGCVCWSPLGFGSGAAVS